VSSIVGNSKANKIDGLGGNDAIDGEDGTILLLEAPAMITWLGIMAKTH